MSRTAKIRDETGELRAATVEDFVKGSNNVVTLTLDEGGTAITGAWTELDIRIGVDGFAINRTSNGAGIALTNGVLTINPANLSESLASLPCGRHRVTVRVKDGTTNTTGAYWGAADSDPLLAFDVSDPP